MITGLSLGCGCLVISEYVFRALPTTGLNAGIPSGMVCVDQFGHAAGGCSTPGEEKTIALLTVNAFQVITAIITAVCVAKLIMCLRTERAPSKTAR